MRDLYAARETYVKYSNPFGKAWRTSRRNKLAQIQILQTSKSTDWDDQAAKTLQRQSEREWYHALPDKRFIQFESIGKEHTSILFFT